MPLTFEFSVTMKLLKKEEADEEEEEEEEEEAGEAPLLRRS